MEVLFVGAVQGSHGSACVPRPAGRYAGKVAAYPWYMSSDPREACPGGMGGGAQVCGVASARRPPEELVQHGAQLCPVRMRRAKNGVMGRHAK